MTSKTRVGHVKLDEYDVYIGRDRTGAAFGDVPVHAAGGLGNPHRVGDHGRLQAVQKFATDFHDAVEDDEELREYVESLSGKTLGCWCRSVDEDGPLCHGDVISRYADELAGVREESTVDDLVDVIIATIDLENVALVVADPPSVVKSGTVEDLEEELGNLERAVPQAPVQYVYDQLVAAKEMRDDYSMVEYCVECDEIRTNSAEFCEPEHTVITDSHDHGGMSEWISCIEYFGLVDDA